MRDRLDYGKEETADQTSHTIPGESAGRGLIGVILRVCLPALLWTVIGISAPVFISQIHHGDRAIQEDFAVYYFSALEMRHGLNPYTTNFARPARASGLDIHGIAICTDPPTFVAIFEALTYLPLRRAYFLWQAINLTCMAAAILLLIGPGSGLRVSTAFTLGALFVLYPPVASHFWFGQSKFPLLLLFVLMMRWMERRQESLAGDALAVAALLRVFPIVIAGYLVLQRRWRTLVYLVAGLLIGSLLTAAFAGVDNTVSFVANIPRFAGHSAAAIQRDIAAYFLVSRAILHFAGHHDPTLDLAGHAIAFVINLIVLSATIRVTLMSPANRDPDYRLFSLWITTAVFLLPIAWDYDLTLMLIPFSQIAVVAARGEASRRAILMATASYALLVWWEYVALSANESGFLSLLTAYLSAYWLALDQPGAVRISIRAMPAEVRRRLMPAT
jgi:Glycosyltransferase family 87